MPLLFAVTLFLSALLLFWVQPLAGKMVLPLLGGAPAVWNTCLLFFQATLLAGYGYVHASTRWLSTRAQVVLHVALLLAAALALPVVINELRGGAPDVGAPGPLAPEDAGGDCGAAVLRALRDAPLLQRGSPIRRTPRPKTLYFLYAASNAGSLLALLAFPVLFEPTLTLGGQSRAWAALYCALVLLVVACAAVSLRARKGVDETREASADDEGDAARTADDESAVRNELEDAGAATLPLRRRLRWALLAFVPSSLVMGVTTYVTTDLVAVPLLWVVPLALYLLSFVIVFARRRVVPRAPRGEGATGRGRDARARLPLGRDAARVVSDLLPHTLPVHGGARLPRPTRRRAPRRATPLRVLPLARNRRRARRAL